MNRAHLESILHKKIDEWQKDRLQSPEDNIISAAEVIKRRFDQLEFHGFNIHDNSNSSTLADVVWREVVEHWGKSCWNKAETITCEMEDDEVEKIDLRDLIEIIYTSCLECS